MSELVKREFTLIELVEYKKSLTPDSEVPEEIVELYEVADSLLKGHVDKAVKLRHGLVAHLAALSEQTANVQWMLDRVEAFMNDATKEAGGQLTGNVFTVRRQKNSQSSLEVENEALIPLLYKKVSASIEADASDLSSLGFLFGVLLGRAVDVKKDLTDEEASSGNFFYWFDITPEEKGILEEKVKISIKTSDLKKALKDTAVSGAKLHQGYHLRYPVKSAAAVKKEIEAEK